ncbi:TPA: hypothetical protein N2Q78_005216 [Citrobacter freundii]|nr:hypothetical protein [Citrobacter freundii]MBA7993523.1 hypothetical protein [Citrobacter freundii]QLN87968.1 hypothetical protein HV119_03390 [Citrobacter freundii]HCL6723602.1 hypothetical protein [Citrobacter freundii]
MTYKDFYHLMLESFSQPVELSTGARKVPFTLYTEEQKLFVRNGKDKTSRIDPKEVAAFVERFEENGSLLAKDYQDVTFKASYLLAAMKYITEQNVTYTSVVRFHSEDALALVEYLIEHDPDHPLVDILVAKIGQYEDEAPEFAEFNSRIAAVPTGVALLRVLMDQHKLTQSDFEEEIGNKSLVSRILKGDCTLTLDHKRALARRFNLPISVFVDP